MKTRFLFLLFLGCVSGVIQAQQSLLRGSGVISSQILSDNRVTFRLVAPNANEVRISGQWMPSQGFIPGSEAMVKGDSGVWSYTTPILPSELYTYFFTVDGLRTDDPSNAFVVRDVANVTNLFIVSGQQGDNYKVNNVLHGTLSRRWYDSPSNQLVRRITIYTPPGQPRKIFGVVLTAWHWW